MTALLSRPETTARLARGVQRMMGDLGSASILEMPLPNGRRADVVALSAKGLFTIVETKSCLEDYAVDAKWPEYLEFCDAYYFAVTEDFPAHALPAEVGLIVADGFGGAVVRPSVPGRLAPARRKMLTLAFARLAAARLLEARSG